MAAASHPLTVAQRVVLTVLADRIVPAACGMPAASDLDLAGKPLARALASRPDLAAAIQSIASHFDGDDPQSYLECLESAAPARFEALLQAVLGAYYMDARVKALIGYDGQRALVLPRSGFGAEELVAEMLDRAPRYRDPDAAHNEGGRGA